MSFLVDVEDLHEVVDFGVWEATDFLHYLADLEEAVELGIADFKVEVLLEQQGDSLLGLNESNVFRLSVVTGVRRILLKALD